MGIRFRKSIKLGPGVRLNLSKSGVGVSAGARGLRYSGHSSGRTTTTASLPGTGLSYVSSSSGSKRQKSASRSSVGNTAAPSSTSHDLPKPGFLAPTSEKRFYEGVQAYLKQDFQKALQAFEAASATDSRNVSDDLFAGVVAMRLDDTEKAIRYLEQVVESDIELPDQLMHKYLPQSRVQLQLAVSITPRVSTPVSFSSLGAALILAELYQEVGQQEEAIGLLQQLSTEVSEDEALKLSLCDLLYEDGDDEGVVEMAVGVVNDSDIGLSCMHLKAKALARQGLTSAAMDIFTECLKRTANRDAELLREVRYDRAALYESVGQAARARKDWEKLYAEDPKYRDVATRLSTLETK